jgi:hypothetical protein
VPHVPADIQPLQAEPPLVDLHAELWRAMRFARHPRVEAMLDGIFNYTLMQWGLARVEYYGAARELYEPCRDGPSLSFVVPVVEGGDTVDLAAIDGMSQHVGTRLGYGRALGLDAVEAARWGDELLLHARPFDWLRAPLDAAYLFDLSEATVKLDGVRTIICLKRTFAERVAALLPPSQRAAVVVAA